MEKGRANAALEQITATMRGATSQRGEMTNLKANTERESAELALRKVLNKLKRAEISEAPRRDMLYICM